MQARVPRQVVAACWVGAVVATALNGVVVGYGAIWFQLFGESPQADDYQVSAGGYAAAAFVLTLAVPAILTHRAPRWLLWPTAALATTLGVLSLTSVAALARAEPVSAPINNAWDGIGGVLWAPWCWVLIALGVRGVVRLATSGRRPSAGATLANGHTEKSTPWASGSSPE